MRIRKSARGAPLEIQQATVQGLRVEESDLRKTSVAVERTDLVKDEGEGISMQADKE